MDRSLKETYRLDGAKKICRIVDILTVSLTYKLGPIGLSCKHVICPLLDQLI